MQQRKKIEDSKKLCGNNNETIDKFKIEFCIFFKQIITNVKPFFISIILYKKIILLSLKYEPINIIFVSLVDNVVIKIIKLK